MLPVSHGGILDDATSHHTDVRCGQHHTVDVAATVWLEGLRGLSCPPRSTGCKAKDRDVGPAGLSDGQITTAITVEVAVGHRKAAEVSVTKRPQP